MEPCPGGRWGVINDRVTVARVCPRLTRFEPRRLVTMATGQACSLWVTGRIPGATRWSAGWALPGGVGGGAVAAGYNYSHRQRRVLVPHLLFNRRRSLQLLRPSEIIHPCSQSASRVLSLAAGGTTIYHIYCVAAGNQLCDMTVPSAHRRPDHSSSLGAEKLVLHVLVCSAKHMLTLPRLTWAERRANKLFTPN